MIGTLLFLSSVLFIGGYGVINESNYRDCSQALFSRTDVTINELCEYADDSNKTPGNRLFIHSVLPEGRDGIHPSHRQRLHQGLLFEVPVSIEFQ